MSLLVNHQPWMLCFRKPVLVRSSPLNSNGVSSSLPQTPPCYIWGANPCGEDLGKLRIMNANERKLVTPNVRPITNVEKKVPLELMKESVTIGASHGWVATLKEDGVLRLQDDLNPYASYTDPKRIPLPPLVTLPHCQTQIVTNVSMSSSSPEDEDCVVAVKFLGPQLSFCRPARGSNSEWTNVRIEHPCFYSSRVMFSKKDDMFRMPGSGGHVIGSWDPHGSHDQKPKLQRLRFRKLPKRSKKKYERIQSSCTSEHLVESRTPGETFLVKRYRRTVSDMSIFDGMKTEALLVFKVDEEGNAVHTQDIGDLVIFISKSEPFCVPASSFPGMVPNYVFTFDADESVDFGLRYLFLAASNPPSLGFGAPYHIPPQNIDYSLFKTFQNIKWTCVKENH